MEHGQIETNETKESDAIAQVRSILEQHAVLVQGEAQKMRIPRARDWDREMKFDIEAAQANKNEEVERCKELTATLDNFSGLTLSMQTYPELAQAIDPVNQVTLPGIGMLLNHAEHILTALGANTKALPERKTKANIEIPIQFDTSVPGVKVRVENHYSGLVSDPNLDPRYVYPTLRLIVPPPQRK